MPDDYYMGDEGGEDAGSSEGMKGNAETGADDSPSATINKSVFPSPPEPGDVCKFRVLRVHDDEVELQYVEEHEGEEGMEDNPQAVTKPSEMTDVMG